ncbi:MAG: DUF1460 domain-containing protein [Bacteroidales bacterium]
MKHIISTILIFLTISTPSIAIEKEIISGISDKSLSETLLEKHSQDTTAIGDRIITIATEFINTPYKSKTIENGQKEKLTINLQTFDCTTFVETILALARTSIQKGKTFDTFVENLKMIRYRNGQISGYTSRLHYFCDWINENSVNRIISIITPENSCRCEVKTINFMTTHASLYPQLKEKKTKKIIAKQEKKLSTETICFIPKDSISNLKPEDIHNGDIIAILTDIKGLDFAHVGFAIIINGKVHLLHASSSAKKVIIDDRTISDYLNSYKSHLGICILRPQ